jgi:hypothetical protein
MFEVLRINCSDLILQKCDLSRPNRRRYDIRDVMGKKIPMIFIFISILGIKQTYLRGISDYPNPN